MVIENVIGGEKPRLMRQRQFGEAVDALAVIAPVVMADGQIERRLEALAKRGQMFGTLGEEREDHALRMGIDVIEGEDAFALLRPPLAEAEQPAERAIGGTIGGIGQQRRPALRQVEPRADDEGEFRVLRRLMRAHDAGQRVAVGHGKGRQPQMLRLHGELLGMRCAAQEGEIAAALKLGVGDPAHADNPWTNHLGGSSPASP